MRPKGMGLGVGDREEPKMELPGDRARREAEEGHAGLGAGAAGGKGDARDQDKVRAGRSGHGGRCGGCCERAEVVGGGMLHAEVGRMKLGQ